MKALRLLTAVNLLGFGLSAFAAVTPKFQEVKIGLWIEGVEHANEEIILGEHSQKGRKVAKVLPEELSVVLDEKLN